MSGRAMENNVRVHNTDNVLKNVRVEVRNGAEWVDIRRCVTGVHWGGNVGDISTVKLELVPAEFYTEGVISHETLEAFAAALRGNGWLVEPPAPAEDASMRDTDRPVVCESCGGGRWQPAPGQTSVEVGIQHLKVCPSGDPDRFVPAWSTGWPYYWAVERGTVPADDLTHQVAWMFAGNLAQTMPLFERGCDLKRWYPYTPETTAEISAAARAKT